MTPVIQTKTEGLAPMIDISLINFINSLSSPWPWIAGLWGVVIGSFLNVCIFRIPEGTFFAKSRSYCRSCGANIPFYLNIPLVSYLFIRGRARCCNSKISIQYPLVELLTGIFFVALYIKYPFMMSSGAGSGGLVWHPADFLRALHGALFLCLLLICSVIDFRLMIIPDVISLPMIALSPLIALVHPDLTLKSSLFGVAAGFGIFYGIAWIYVLVRKEYGLGMGDVKLLAAMGGWLGVEAVLPIIFYGSLVGSVVGIGALIASRKVDLKTALPFGPFLALGAAIHLFWTNLMPELLGL